MITCLKAAVSENLTLGATGRTSEPDDAQDGMELVTENRAFSCER